MFQWKGKLIRKQEYIYGGSVFDIFELVILYHLETSVCYSVSITKCIDSRTSFGRLLYWAVYKLAIELPIRSFVVC